MSYFIDRQMAISSLYTVHNVLDPAFEKTLFDTGFVKTCVGHTICYFSRVQNAKELEYFSSVNKTANRKKSNIDVRVLA